MALKNRPKENVENCIKTLRMQDYSCNIIIVDYGSREENLHWERRILPDAITTLIEVKNNTSIFNKSRALNIGIKRANTKYILSTDIDCLFSPNFTEEVVNILEKQRAVILCQKIDLDENREMIGTHEPSASGSCIGLTKEWLMKVHGYDEKYTQWGREDNDLVDRAIQDGHKTVWITEKVKLYHQWHEPAPNDTLHKNIEYYNKLKKPLVRNKNIWGEL
jgi:GT2 family glycosyltransferase